MRIELILTDGPLIVEKAVVQTDATPADFAEVADAVVNNLDLDGVCALTAGVSAYSTEAESRARVRADAYEASVVARADAEARARDRAKADDWEARVRADVAVIADAKSRGVFVIDTDRWKEFLSTVPAFASFTDSAYYNYGCQANGWTFLRAAGKKGDIARIYDVPKFLSSIRLTPLSSINW